MIRKFSLGIVIFFGVMLINISALAFQQRYDRREREKGDDPFAIELADHDALKLLRNVYFWEYPLPKAVVNEYECYFYLDKRGAGEKYIYRVKTFAKSQLKFVLLNFEGFFDSEVLLKTLVWDGRNESFGS